MKAFCPAWQCVQGCVLSSTIARPPFTKFCATAALGSARTTGLAGGRRDCLPSQKQAFPFVPWQMMSKKLLLWAAMTHRPCGLVVCW
jgi:hypothetical protein